MEIPELNSDQREALKRSLLETRETIAEALEQLQAAEPLTLLDALRLMMDAVQPAHSSVQEQIDWQLHHAGIYEPLPFPASVRADYVEDAYTLRGTAQRIAEVVLDQTAFEAARNEPEELSDLVETALVASINLRDFTYPTWQRVRREHLARGYEIVAAGRYVLYGEQRFGFVVGSDDASLSEDVELRLPSDIENFPQLPDPRDEPEPR